MIDCRPLLVLEEVSVRSRPHRWLWRVLRPVAWLAAGLLLTLALAVLALRWAAPPTTSFILQARIGAVLSDPPGPAVEHVWVDWDHLSPALALAAVAAEDQRFPDHGGFDLVEIRAALTAAQDGRPVRGASTITQQVAKNLFLWSGRSWLRKGLEAYVTVLLELLWPKRRILEVYLNVAQFGPSTFGAEAASRRFFGKPADRVDAAEAALLAAVLPNPHRLWVDRPSRHVRQRQAWIQRQMGQLGYGYVEGL